ncbi:hypothetical protein JCM14713_28500 [Desulfomicrobium salsuginis]
MPPERELSGRLGVSRNTLRGLLKSLDARGVVIIKPGSGTYLRTSLAAVELPDRKSPRAVADQLKAAFLFLPPILCKALQTSSATQIDDLHACNIALSQAMCSGNPHEIWAEIVLFFRVIVRGTGNSFLAETVERIFSIDPAFVARFFQADREALDDIFAGHVSILQTLRERNHGRISVLTGQYLLSLCRALESGGFSVWDPVSDDKPAAGTYEE